MIRRRPTLDVDRPDREHRREVGAWRGLVTQLRGGGESALDAQDPANAVAMAQALHAAADVQGLAAFVHTRRCRKRNDTCTCAGVRLVPGAKA